jgi:hypothetical protein
MKAAVGAMSDRVERAHRVEQVLQALGWVVAAVGLIGAAVFVFFWIAGDLSSEQAVSLILGTTLATILSGATAYGAGVNVGLSADRLSLALADADRFAEERARPPER